MIAIIAILFPVFAQAKESAKKTACLSNSKQLALGVPMYSADIPVVHNCDTGISGGIAAQLNWNMGVKPYIKQNLWGPNTIWKCSGLEADYTITSSRATPATVVISGRPTSRRLA